MKKIPCLFERDFSNRRRPILLVLEGKGIATQKRDGTACLVQNGKLFKRYDLKRMAADLK